MFRAEKLAYIDNWKDLKNFDTWILCADGQCAAHRLVLCHASPFMGSLLDDQFPGEPTYYSLPDVSKDVMSLLLELAYTGKLTCGKRMLEKVRETMKLLGWIRMEYLDVSVQDTGDDHRPDKAIDAKVKAAEPINVQQSRMKEDGDGEVIIEDGLVTSSTDSVETTRTSATDSNTLTSNNKSNGSTDDPVNLTSGDEQEADAASGNDARTVNSSVMELKNHAPDVEEVVAIGETRKSENSKIDARLQQTPGKRVTRSRQTPHSSPSPESCKVAESLIATAPRTPISNLKRDNLSQTPSPARRNLRRKLTPESNGHAKDLAEGPPVKKFHLRSGEDIIRKNGEESESTSPGNSEKDAGRMVNEEPSNGSAEVESERENRSRDNSLSANAGSDPQVPGNRKGKRVKKGILDACRRASSRLASGQSTDSDGSRNSSSCSMETNGSNTSAKIPAEDWKKITTCDLCHQTHSTIKNANICISSHGHTRCWSCLVAIPSGRSAEHMVKVHSLKGSQDNMSCRWCSEEGNNAWLAKHVLTHNS